MAEKDYQLLKDKTSYSDQDMQERCVGRREGVTWLNTCLYLMYQSEVHCSSTVLCALFIHVAALCSACKDTEHGQCDPCCQRQSIIMSSNL